MRPFAGSKANRYLRRHSGSLAALALVFVLGNVATARQEQGQLRTVHGTVLSAKNEPLANAVVYLKNMRTLSVRTYISSHGGRYHFSGLDPNVDYTIHAELQNQHLTSSPHRISSFDTKREIVVDLKVDRKKANP